MPPMPPVTKLVMMICAAVFGLTLLLPGVFESTFALWPIASTHFAGWQIFTYALMHADLMHLAFNLMGLWMFGSELERLWGKQRYIHFLIASILSAAFVQIVWGQLTHNIAPTVGISGALFGLLLAYGMLFPDRIIVPLIPPIPMKAKYFVAIYGGIELFFGFSGSSGVAHFAHLGGMLGGFLMIRYWRGQFPFK